MTAFGDLLGHAERCQRLADSCTDDQVAMRLNRLAREYRDLATCTTTRKESFVIDRDDSNGAKVGDRFPRSIAFHEAGHAVIAWSFNLPVGMISIDGRDGRGKTEIAGAHQLPMIEHLAILAAGYNSESLFSCEGHQQMACNDHARIVSVLEAHGVPTSDHPKRIADANLCARSRLNVHRSHVLRVVERLVIAGRIDGEEFSCLMLS